jgi:streptogramin lyase
VQAPSTIQTTSNPVQGTALQGKVHGGQQPIVGASVYLYAANTTGYGGPGIAPSSSNASVSLLTSAGNTTKDGSNNYYVTTDSGGNFTITGDYSCPANAQVYLYSIGGNPGVGGNNSAAGLLAAVGPCSSLTSSTFVFVDEVSTIATAWALAGFASDPTHIASSNSALALTGMKNAFATVANLETLSTGLALATTPAGNGQVPQSSTNTLADILAACVNSTGPGSAQCTTLLTNAENGAVTPTDTAMAAINIAHNPGANVSTLFALKTSTSPFQPTWNRAASDFTIVINYTGGGIQEDNGVAIDASGNVWVANNASSSITEVSPVGAILSSSSGITGGGLNSPYRIAIDASGNIWVTNFGGSTLSEYNPTTSTWVSGTSGYTGGGLKNPEGLAIDSAGNVWVANEGGNSLSEYNPTSGWDSALGYTGGGLSMPHTIAIDLLGNVWVPNDGASSISEFSSAGVPSASSPITGGGLEYPPAIALDASGNLWMPNYNNVLSEYNPTSGWVSTTGYTGGGLSDPEAVAIDGAGNIWVSNYFGSFSEFSSSGTAMSGTSAFGGGWNLSYPFSIAIDGSGNLWLTNAQSTSGNLSEAVGLCIPVVTPVVANFLTPYGSHAVNKP